MFFKLKRAHVYNQLILVAHTPIRKGINFLMLDTETGRWFFRISLAQKMWELFPCWFILII